MMCPIHGKQDEQILMEYCLGTLDPRQALQVEQHATRCGECAAWIANQRAVWTALDDFRGPEVSPEFQARLYQRIEERRHAGWWSRIWGAAWKPAVASAALGAVLAIAVAVKTSWTSGRTSSAGAETVDMDQMEHVLEDLDLLTPGYGGSRL